MVVRTVTKTIYLKPVDQYGDILTDAVDGTSNSKCRYF